MISVMRRKTIRGLFPIGIIFTAIYVLPARAQTPPCVDKVKLPYPTFAEEIRSENGERPFATVVLGDLRIEGDVHDRDALQKRILKDFSGKEFLYENELIDKVNELGILEDLQRRGFFEATVNSDAQPLDIRDRKKRYLVIAQVEEGERFRLGEISFQGADPGRSLKFPGEKLRPLVHLQTGDIFNAAEIRRGIERLTRFYGSFGYMDFTAEPDFEFDHSRHSISVVLKLSEQNPYRVASFEISGLDPNLEGELRAKIRLNQIFNYNVLNDFYEQNRAALSRYEDPKNSVQIHRDIVNSTVSLNFVFTICPSPFN
jgi:outer membrane protein assembly factor BamA